MAPKMPRGARGTFAFASIPLSLFEVSERFDIGSLHERALKIAHLEPVGILDCCLGALWVASLVIAAFKVRDEAAKALNNAQETRAKADRCEFLEEEIRRKNQQIAKIKELVANLVTNSFPPDQPKTAQTARLEQLVRSLVAISFRDDDYLGVG